MENTGRKVAEYLLQINAIKLDPANPFTWASGWKSPIYCDNRKTLSFPGVRGFLADSFVALARSKYPRAEIIAGVATGAIAHGMLVADRMGLPFIYVRSAPKGHGLENLIEGELKPQQKVVVVEDLISTGSSSLKAVEAIRLAGGNVLGMMAIFTYQFPQATSAFNQASVKLDTLSDYGLLLEQAVSSGFISQSDLSCLKQWREDPSQWGK